MSYGTDAPAYWDPSLAGDKSSTLGQEQCIIKDEHFFVRGRLVIPVTDATGTEFAWGVWVSLSRDSFTRALSLWTTPGREREQPSFGWMSTELPLYQPSTLSLKTRVHTLAVGQRPLIELEPTDHPLAVEQRTGITLARVQEIAETLLHALPAPLRAHDRHLTRLSSVHADSCALRLGAVDADLTHRHTANCAMTRPFPWSLASERLCQPGHRGAGALVVMPAGWAGRGRSGVVRSAVPDRPAGPPAGAGRPAPRHGTPARVDPCR
jgi:hypothetical protein